MLNADDYQAKLPAFLLGTAFDTTKNAVMRSLLNDPTPHPSLAETTPVLVMLDGEPTV